MSQNIGIFAVFMIFFSFGSNFFREEDIVYVVDTKAILLLNVRSQELIL